MKLKTINAYLKDLKSELCSKHAAMLDKHMTADYLQERAKEAILTSDPSCNPAVLLAIAEIKYRESNKPS
jgi:hypothetical protein